MEKEVIKEETANKDGIDKSIEIKTTDDVAESKPTQKYPSIGDDDDDTLLNVINAIDKVNEGAGQIKEIPQELKMAFRKVVNQMIALREVFEDPEFKPILEDMVDQKEDGAIPSVRVAIARNIPIEELVELADSEDYQGAQAAISDGIAQAKTAEEDEAAFQEAFEKSQKAGQAYAASMGYDENRTNELFQKVLELFKVMGDGVLTEAEFADVDKMLNYGPDTEALQSQISTQDAKEVLPDKASVESIGKAPEQRPVQTNAPGMGSVAAYQDPLTDITAAKGQNRRNGRG